MFDCKVFIRVVELLLCIACVVALRVTDDESRRVFHYLRNRSREWSLLNNVTWGTIGAALATATCGGYVIITAGLLLAAATGELQGRKTEIFFLGLGIILFAIVGALSLASIESVPDTLVDNAAVLGGLCLLTALVFIVDLLLKPKHKKNGSQTFVLKDNANSGKPTSTVFSSEKESHSVSATTTTNGTSNQKQNSTPESGNVNGGFEKVEKRNREIEKSQVPRSDRRTMAPKGTDENTLERAERQFREYTRKFEDFDNPTVVFKSQDIYQRPVDEVDTPRFPSHFDRKTEPMFAKIVNPSVKIMRVERDTDDGFENYRYSDSSQYDNVPTRMRGGTSPGILKKSRPDVTYNVSSKDARQESERTIDEIEMLEECFGVLRPKVTTGTQTSSGNPQIRTPSTPIDPGYVRHTANNWPKDFKSKGPKNSSVD